MARVYPMDRPALDPVTDDAGRHGSASHLYCHLHDRGPVAGRLCMGWQQRYNDVLNSRQAVTEFAIGGNPVRIRALLAPTDRREVRIKWLAAPQRAHACAFGPCSRRLLRPTAR